MYKLYTDKKEMFECDISLSGASLKDATARLIIETDTVNLLYKGTIGSNGNCKVPVQIRSDSRGHVFHPMGIRLFSGNF